VTKKTNHPAHHTAHHAHKDSQTEEPLEEGAVPDGAVPVAEAGGEAKPEAEHPAVVCALGGGAAEEAADKAENVSGHGSSERPTGMLPEGLDAQKLLIQLEKYRAELQDVRTKLRERETELDLSRKLSQETVQKLKDEHELRVRAAADMENYRKRVMKEREDTAKFGQERLVKNLLPVLDNLERALAAENRADPTALQQGVEMTRKLFEKTLSDIGVVGFSAVGKPFDPACHEAMQAVESDETPGTVISEMVRGYMMHDRLIRPAMVFVAKPRSPKASSDAVGVNEDSGASGAEQQTAEGGTASEQS
jgi:Molecular chaperone GrpE (heat shock protein)